MSNAWIQDSVQRQPWVRSCGPHAHLLYIYASNLIHLECRERAVLTRQELRDEYPHPIDDREFDGALERLAARDKIVLDGDRIELPLYFAEQESNEARRDHSAKQAKRARDAVANRKRDALGRLIATQPEVQPAAGESSQRLDSRLADPASYPVLSGPVRSDPVQTMSPTGAGAAAPPRSDPPTKPPRPKRAAHPNRQTYLADFHEAHKAASGGGTYSWSGRELVALDGCCADYPPDRWKAACASLAARRPEWLFRNGETPDLGAFRRNFNAFAAAAALPTTGRSASTTRPGHADPFDFIRIGQEMERDGLFQVRDRAACPERGASPDFDAGR